MKNKISVIFFLSMIKALIFAQYQQYCDLKCKFGEKQIFTHTVCERELQQCKFDETRCGSDAKILNLSDAQRQLIVDLHNYYRNKVAMGEEKRGNQPSATNMKALKYNRELEFIAQCWANTCHSFPLKHDKCRRTEKYEHVGQNLGIYYSSSDVYKIEEILHTLITQWYNEVANFQSNWVDNFKSRGPSTVIGHYTQMVWANTSEIGCALTYFKNLKRNKEKHNVLVVCNYGPGGNYRGYSVYEKGLIRSGCGGVKESNVSTYKGLCV